MNGLSNHSPPKNERMLFITSLSLYLHCTSGEMVRVKWRVKPLEHFKALKCLYTFFSGGLSTKTYCTSVVGSTSATLVEDLKIMSNPTSFQNFKEQAFQLECFIF